MAQNASQKAETYRNIKVVGLISFIPLILVAGPIGGYFIGEYLEKQFNLPAFTPIALATMGFFASAKETVRIIAMLVKMDKRP